MTDPTDLRTTRARLESLEAAIGRLLARPPGRTPARAVQIRQGPGYVATAGRFFLARPLELAGAGSEGATGVARDAGEGIPDWAVRVLRSAPSAGEILIARGADHRWHAERGVGAGGPAPPDGCTRIARVVGCGEPALPIPGAPIRWRALDGIGTTFSGTTDANGLFSVTHTVGAGIWEVDPYCGFRGLTRLDPVACDSPILRLGPDANHRCAPCARWPIPRVLSFTGSRGTATLTAVGAGTTATVWAGVLNFTGRSAGVDPALIECPCPPGVNGGQPLFWPRLTVNPAASLSVEVYLTCAAIEGSWSLIWGGVYPIAGLTGCASCDWGYAPASALWLSNFTLMDCGGGGFYRNVASTVSSSCGSFAASGAFTPGCAATLIAGTCRDPRVAPIPDDCIVTMSDHPIESWAVTGVSP